jgi:hypothetical protein
MGMQDSKYTNMLASHTSVLLPREPRTPALDYPYLSAIGRLLWLTLTVHPNIAYIVRALAQHTQSYTQAHITTIKQVLHYLNHTSDIGITYKTYNRDNREIEYCNTSYSNPELQRKSLSGYIFMYCQVAVAWFSKSQSVVATLTQESEYIALAHATKQALCMHQLLAELGLHPKEPRHILTNNQVSLALTTSTGTAA